MDEKTGIERVLGLVILVLRKLHRWTQEELAERAGLSGGSISYYEQGDVVPPRDALRKIAAAARVTLEDVDRLAAEIFRLFERIDPASLLLGQGDLAASITTELAEDFRARAFPEVNAFLSARRKPPAAAEEARREARFLWVCLERIGTHRLPRLAAAGPELLSWAVCELLAEKSEEAAVNDKDRALDLAHQALWVAERLPDTASRRQSEGYAWAFVSHARRVRRELREAEEAIDLAFKLWEEGATGEPGFLDGTRLLDLKASLRIDQRRLAEARSLLAEAAAQIAPDLSLGRILLKDAYALELMGDSLLHARRA
jgi:transcriptional regulator with XRE-family HTH domain